MPPGKYRAVLTYKNSEDGVRLRPVGVKGEPVKVWKGELRAPTIEMELTKPQEEMEPQKDAPADTDKPRT